WAVLPTTATGVCTHGHWRRYSGLTKIRTRRRSRRQYKQYGTDSLGASAP
ncbi:TPA: hypothetical protein WHM98_001299, partial [Neisseria meningitidis]